MAIDKLSPEDVAEQMQHQYEKAFNEIIGRLHVSRNSTNYWKTAHQAQLLKQIAEILDEYKGSTGDYLKKALHKLAEYETQLAVEDLQKFKDALAHTEDFYAAYHKEYVGEVFKDAYAHIAGQTDRMAQAIKTSLRQDTQEIMRRAAVEGITRRKAYRLLRDTILSRDPDFRFVDKSGKKWNSKVYFDMMTHTVMSTTQRNIYANTLANEGHDLVKIPQNGAKDACLSWEGRILSLTGATPGYPTLAEATATGEIFHPRCRHRVVAYDVEIDDLFEQERNRDK